MNAENRDLQKKLDEEYVLKVPAAKLAKGASKGLMLVLDFGGCKENTTVKISGIVLQKTAE